MALSVIVTAYKSRATLLQCLAALQPQVAEIVVADCSPDDPTAEIAARFPNVKVRHFAQKTRVPAMRWAMVRETTGEFVAAVEGRCVPAADWAATLLAAHGPGVNAVGGSVAFEGSGLDEAVWACEYSKYAPPLPDAVSADISGANLSYRRAALLEHPDILEGGQWETLLHLRWPGRLRTANAVVTFHNALSASEFLAQRFAYGRNYAAARGLGSLRFVFGLGALVLPVLLTARVYRGRQLAWIFLFQSAWAMGELVGYWFGPGEPDAIY